MLAVIPSLIAALTFSLVASSCGEWCAERFHIPAESGATAGLVLAALAVPTLVAIVFH